MTHSDRACQTRSALRGPGGGGYTSGMVDDKDRLGQKLRDKERTEEERYFKQKEQEAIEKARQAQRTASEAEVQALARDRCPRCGERLSTVVLHGVTVDECPAGHGTWLDQGELKQLATRERDSWIARYVIRPKSVT